MLAVADGKISVRVRGMVKERLGSFLRQVKGRRVLVWKVERVKYFNWHARLSVSQAAPRSIETGKEVFNGGAARTAPYTPRGGLAGQTAYFELAFIRT